MPVDRQCQAPPEVMLRSFLRAAASFGTRPGNAATDRFLTDSSSAAGESEIMARFVLQRNPCQSIKDLDGLNDLRFFDDALHPPGLGLGELAAGFDFDQVAFLVLVVLVVRVVLLRARDDLAIERVLHPSLDEHGDRLVHLVADYPTNLGLDEAALGVRSTRYRRFNCFRHACPAFWLSNVFTR